jgi:hypothetical protein
VKPNRCGKLLSDEAAAVAGVTQDGRFACGLDDGHRGLCGAPWRPWKRSNYVPAPHFFALNHACRLVNDALGGFGCYLVGSSCERRDYRDVDVRFIMGDADYDRLFRAGGVDPGRDVGGWLNPLWSLMCTSISLWLSQQTGLPIDFQIQRQTQANAQHGGQRHALGIFLDYPGERPSDLKPPPPEAP